MPAVQKLYNVCKTSLSTNGPVSEDAIQKVRSMLGSKKLIFLAYLHLNLFNFEFLSLVFCIEHIYICCVIAICFMFHHEVGCLVLGFDFLFV